MIEDKSKIQNHTTPKFNIKETKISTNFTGSPYLEYLPKMMDWVEEKKI